jgi:hypothetical protein
VFQARGRLITDGISGDLWHPQYRGLFLVLFGSLVH